RITRESGAVRGRAAILAGLDALAEEAKKEAGDRPRETTTFRSAEIEGCRAGMEALFAALDRVCRAPDWAGAARALLDLITRLYRGSPGRALLHHVLATLEDLDAGALVVDPTNVFEAASELLEEGAVSSGRVKRGGVNILPLDRASGLDFRAVILPGMALRRFPPPPREDPILLDEERLRLRDDPAFASLTPRGHRLGEEAYHFASAVAGARDHLVLCFPGYDPAMGRAQAPSTFLLRVHETREGRNLDLETLLERHVTSVPVFTGFNERGPADTVQAFDRSLLGKLDAAGRKAYLESVSPESRRMAARRAALFDPSRLSPFDGWMKSQEALAVVRKKFGKRPGFSPTGLEAYARCPYRFFLQRVVRITPLEDPVEEETAEECDPMHKGLMVHEVLEQFHRWLAVEGKKKTPTERACRKALEEAAAEVFDGQEKAGAVGSPAVWAAERARLLEEMWVVVTDDLAGLDDFRPREFEKNLTTLIDLPGKKGGRLSLFGFADRIDRSADGRAVRVVDYKVTSGRVKKKNESFQGGEALQLPLYLLMAQEGMASPDLDRSEGVYYFLSRKQGFRKVSFSGRDWKRKTKTLLRILQTIADGIHAGLFPQNPGRWDRFLGYYTHCSWCDYEIICGKRRRDRMIEILDAPPGAPARLKKYVEMGTVDKLWE
ncbi:MAG: PD-(D/E)XK nuclease family protein, partial [Planctomycetota bacterium]